MLQDFFDLCFLQVLERGAGKRYWTLISFRPLHLLSTSSRSSPTDTTGGGGSGGGMLAKGSGTERYSDAESGDRKREKDGLGV